MTIPSLPQVDQVLGDLMKRVEPWAQGRGRAFQAHVRGEPGTGKSTVLRKLVDEAPRHGCRVVYVEAPELDLDLATHVVFQTFGALRSHGENGKLDPIVERKHAFSSKLAVLGSRLRCTQPVLLVIDLPESWSRVRGEALETTSVVQRVHDAIRTMLDSSSERHAVVIAGGDPVEDFEPFDLQRALDAKSFLCDASRWGKLASSARTVWDALKEDPPSLSPLDWRIAVALHALGNEIGVDHRTELDVACYRGHRALVALLARELRSRGGLARAMSRLSAARFGVRAATLAALLGDLKPTQREIVGALLLERDGMYELHSSLRRGLARDLPAPKDAHDLWLKHEPEVRAADIKSSADAVACLERVHHAALAWRVDLVRSQAPDAVYLVELARAASLRGDYDLAIELYQEALVADPDDVYALHYLGFNLERAGMESDRALAAFVRSTELEPKNPWFQRRLTCAYLRRGRVGDAVTAWRVALQQVDAARYAAGADPEPWLTRNLHLDTARLALDYGQLDFAEEILTDAASRGDEAEIRKLRSTLAHLEEADEIGFPVFPDDVPFEERWDGPHLAGELGRDARAWFPGRIAAVAQDAIHLELVTPPGSPDEPPEPFGCEMSTEAFQEQANLRRVSDLQPGQMIELVELVDGSQRIFLWAPRARPRDDERRDLLRGWRPEGLHEAE